MPLEQTEAHESSSLSQSSTNAKLAIDGWQNNDLFAAKTQLQRESSKQFNDQGYIDFGDPALQEYGKFRVPYENDVQPGTHTPLLKLNLSSPIEAVNTGSPSKTRDKAADEIKQSSEKDCVPEISSERQTQLESATAQILHTAQERFGSAEIANMQIAKDDVAAATSALLLGPEICKLIGPKETQNFGKRLIVFGIAPAFGAFEEANKQFTEHSKETIHGGSANFLTGTAIGAILERMHPLVLGTVTVGVGGMLLHDQLSSPEHQARNAQIVDISSKIDNASNAELILFANQSKQLLGPDLYKDAFTLATGGAGIPEGQAVGTLAKEEGAAVAKAASKIDLKELAANLGKWNEETWTSFKNLCRGEPGLQPALADGPTKSFAMSWQHPERISPEDKILRMQGKPGGNAFGNLDESLKLLRNDLNKLDKLPYPEKFESLNQINADLLHLAKEPVSSRPQADAIAAIEDQFQMNLKSLKDEVNKQKPTADAIEAKPESERSLAEQEQLEKHYAAEDTLYGVLSERLKGQYGWDGHTSGMMDRSISMQSGFGSQKEICNSISAVLNRGLEKFPEVQNVLKKNDLSSERARGWIGIPMAERSAADHAGCDYLLVNKNTGEMYAIDTTERTLCMRHGRLVDSRLTNKNLGFPEKKVPLERKDTVIGIADDTSKDNLIYQERSKNPTLSREQIEERIKQNQLAEIIAETISRPSPLNILDVSIPSGSANLDASRSAYELWRFREGLSKIGYADWARSLNASLGFLRSQNRQLPHY